MQGVKKAAMHACGTRMQGGRKQGGAHGAVGDELRRDGLDLARPGGREEERLALRGDGAHDLLDLRLEAHVQHAVRLVQHQVAHLRMGRVARSGSHLLITSQGKAGSSMQLPAESSITQTRALQQMGVPAAAAHAAAAHAGSVRKEGLSQSELWQQGRASHRREEQEEDEDAPAPGAGALAAPPGSRSGGPASR